MGMYARLERRTDTQEELTPIVVFTAFAIESYLNSIGARKIAFWDDLERLPWRQKVSILHKAAGTKPDWGRDPLQFASEVFGLRDKLAHGKPERVVSSPQPTEHAAGELLSSQHLQPEWYGGITRDWALKAMERFRNLMIYLGGLHGLHESDHLMSSSGGIMLNPRLDA
jgi:hypothetical protein